MSRRMLCLVWLVVLASSLILVTAVSADGTARITWYAFTTGGGHSSSMHYMLDGSMGQPAVGLASSTNFRLGGGFWYLLGIPQEVFSSLFLPIVLKGYH